MQFIVKVGATRPDGPRDQYSDCEGFNFFGPMNGLAAQELKEALDNEFMKALAENGPDCFVYGVPTVEVSILWPDEIKTREEIARNWYMTKDDKETLEV